MTARSRKWYRALGKVLFVLYVAFVIYFLIFSDWYGRTGAVGYRYNLELFKEIKRFWNYREQVGITVMLMNLAGNIIIFVPFGFFMPMASKYRSFLETMFAGFVLSFVVEIFQLVTKVGSFDVDDILLNTLGGVIGYIAFGICNAIRRNHDRNRKRKR